MQILREEITSNSLQIETINDAVQHVQINGYVMLENILPRDQITILFESYMNLFERYLENPDPHFGTNHYCMHLPFTLPFSDERISANPLLIPILEQLLGVDFVCHYFASNTCMPGSDYQPVHSDAAPLFPKHTITLPVYAIVLNIPLVDVTLENGPMEMWPGGTHLNTPNSKDIEKLAQNMMSTLAVMSAGSVLIRDARMWHRGTKNRSSLARPQLAIVYKRPWVISGTKINISRDIYDTLSTKAKEIFRYENIS